MRSPWVRARRAHWGRAQRPWLAVAAYAPIDPTATGSRADLPYGSMIVREVLGASGEVAKLTMMAKGPIGANPGLGDWWFAVTDPRGTPLVDDAGAEQVGALAACTGCHLARQDDGFLFGVAAVGRLP